MLTSGGGEMQKFPKILKKNWGFYVWTNHLFWYKKASLKKGRHICFNARSINHFNTRAKLTEISWTTLIKSKTHNKWIGNVTKATDFWVVLTCPSFVTWPRLVAWVNFDRFGTPRAEKFGKIATEFKRNTWNIFISKLFLPRNYTIQVS